MPVDSEKEIRLAKAIKSLPPRELDAYRYFVRNRQAEISEEKADEMFELYLAGQSCEDIRRVVAGFSLGQIVGCRVMREWDEKKKAHRDHLVEVVPEQSLQTSLETVDFLGLMLKATMLAHADKLRKYIATQDATHLEGVPLPKNVKEVNAILEMFMKATGQDKKRVETTVTITHKGPSTAISSEEAADILDAIVYEPPKAIAAPQKGTSPGTPDEMLALLEETK